MQPESIGLFGGTFDPPHFAHLILASEAAHQFQLSRVLWMLAPDPPHKQKQPITPLRHRLEMLQRATADNPYFEISRLEIERPGPHYTVDTLRLLTAQHPNTEITLLIGGDSLRDLPSWREPAAIVNMVRRIGIMRRPNIPLDLKKLEEQIPGLTEKTTFLDVLLQELSSSELRQRIALGKPYRYYLPPAVFDYIETHRLYKT